MAAEMQHFYCLVRCSRVVVHLWSALCLCLWIALCAGGANVYVRVCDLLCVVSVDAPVAEEFGERSCALVHVCGAYASVCACVMRVYICGGAHMERPIGANVRMGLCALLSCVLRQCVGGCSVGERFCVIERVCACMRDIFV